MILLNGREVKFDTFPNGETKMVEDSIHFQGVNRISFKYENDGDLIKLMFLKKYLDNVNPWVRHGAFNLLTIYYMPYSRMDRSENDSAFTLKYVAEFINSLKFDDVDIIEPHSDVTPALVDNSNSVMITHQLLPKVMEEASFVLDYDYVVFPDSGASKRYSKLNLPNTIVAHKVRNFETGKIEKLELLGDIEDINGRVALIVDDLSSYGGTFLLTAKALKEKGFGSIYLLVGHAETSILHGDMFKSNSPIKKVFTTDTIIHHIDTENIKVFKIEELLADE